MIDLLKFVYFLLKHQLQLYYRNINHRIVLYLNNADIQMVNQQL